MRFLDAMGAEATRLGDLEARSAEGLALLAAQAHDERLRRTLLEGRRAAEGQARAMDQVRTRLAVPPERASSRILAGVQWEARETLSGIPAGPLADALIVAFTQKIIHLKIASYGTLRALALRMADDKLAEIFERCLDEEKRLDIRLTETAETGINQAAVVEVREGTRR